MVGGGGVSYTNKTSVEGRGSLWNNMMHTRKNIAFTIIIEVVVGARGWKHKSES